jgi:hypothetical protein
VKTKLAALNVMVRQWADRQPPKYRLSALAFGYRCDVKSQSFDGTLKWISNKTRGRPNGEFVSLRTLKDHLRVFEAHGVIRVQRHRNGSRNKSSIYFVDFDKSIEATEGMGNRQRRRARDERAGYEDHLASLDAEADRYVAPEPEPARSAMLTRPPMPTASGGHNIMQCQCPPCREYIRAFKVYWDQEQAQRRDVQTCTLTNPLPTNLHSEDSDPWQPPW